MLVLAVLAVIGLPVCSLACLDPGTPAHALRSPAEGSLPSSVPVGTTVYYSCVEGYELKGSHKITCTADSEWFPIGPPECRANFCEDPRIPHGKISGELMPGTHDQFVIKTFATLICEPGFEQGTTSENYCMPSGEWARDWNYCIDIDECLSSPCDNGGQCINLQAMYVCQCTTSWIGANCQTNIDCEAPPASSIPNGHYVIDRSRDASSLPDHYAPNSFLHYRCNSGYKLTGNPNRVCQAGQWVGDIPVCVMQGCDVPPLVTHASYLPAIVQTPVVVGTTIQYTCSNGYVLEGTQTMQCHSSGMWLPSTAPICIPIESHTVFCDDPGKPEHGRRCCQKVFYPSMKLNYYCDEGYYLRGSEERTCQADSSWTGVQPICVPVGTISPIPDSDTQLWTSDTMTIITATTGSILGLLIVTVILTSRHCHSRRNHAYHRVLRARLARMPEADTAALLAVAENVNIVLPTYEEATATGPPGPPPFEDTSSDTGSSARPAQRPLQDPMQGRPLLPVPSDDSSAAAAGNSNQETASSTPQQTVSVSTQQQTEDATTRADMGVGTEDSEMQEMSARPSTTMSSSEPSVSSSSAQTSEPNEADAAISSDAIATNQDSSLED